MPGGSTRAAAGTAASKTISAKRRRDMGREDGSADCEERYDVQRTERV
jgi:hypothetical protein